MRDASLDRAPATGLPIDGLLPQIGLALVASRDAVLVAEPGAGKTTRVPPYLLTQLPGEVLVLEPRRIAARAAARRVAQELGEAVGETVGYQVRFESVGGPRTRLRFLTEGVLTRRLLKDPELRGVSCVVLDEFHERHLDTDLALALLVRLQSLRPELRLLVMSATLLAEPIAAFLGDCPVLRSAGRSFPLTIRYEFYATLGLEDQVRAALLGLLRSGHQGHILIFLPGAAEIRRCLRLCDPVLRDFGATGLPLYGELSPAEQDRAIDPGERKKVIFATNVAESSVTIEGVTAVIDSGLARVASYSPWTGLPVLQIQRISRASATQRGGRAGRTAPGTVVRLYPPEDFVQRPEEDTPELLRSDLGGLCLSLRAMGLSGFGALRWLDPPPPEAVVHAEALLDQLGATGDRAIAMAQLPLTPRLGRMLLEAERRGVSDAGVAVAALLSARTKPGVLDVLDALELPAEPDVEQQRRQLRKLVSRSSRRPDRPDEELGLALLTGFPDRVARRAGGERALLSAGGSAEFGGPPPAYDLLLALDIEDRKDRPLPQIRMAARIEPEWLLDLHPERLQEHSHLEWNRVAERVEQVAQLRYDDLVLESSRGSQPEAGAASALLAEEILQAGPERFLDGDALENLRSRFFFAGLSFPDLQHELETLCYGLRSFAEFREIAPQLLSALETGGGATLQRMAPASLRLPAGRVARVHYEVGKPPWIASRLQDFFGMTETPRIGPDHAPVVVHLLAPNGRAEQTTTDLAGFWQRLYPELRRTLMRRYPRHAWPEDPSVAQPPLAKKAR